MSGNDYYVGGLAGFNVGAAAQIDQCYSAVTVSGTTTDVGGFVGGNVNGASIADCYCTGDVSGAWNVGGFAGINHESGDPAATIDNCYASGSVTSSSLHAGGFLGDGVNPGVVTDSFYAGTSLVAFGGGIFTGYAYSGATFANCYYNEAAVLTLGGEVVRTRSVFRSDFACRTIEREPRGVSGERNEPHAVGL